MVYFIPTPIGNLEDITLRSLKLLSQCSTLFCEDTRITKKLLQLLEQKHTVKFTISNFISMHSHNEEKLLENLDISIFEKDVAYLSDAGMPCISDPGAKLIGFCQKNNIDYEVLPGASAALLAYASSGFLNSKFYFYGFLPHKNRKEEWDEILTCKVPTIIYESCHRIEKFSKELQEYAPDLEVCFIKEATKKYERRFSGLAKDVCTEVLKSNTKGEWVIVLNTKRQSFGTAITKEDILKSDIPPKQKAKLLAKVTGESVSFWYQNLIS